MTLPPPLPDHVEPGKTKITTLPNGVKVASETSAVWIVGYILPDLSVLLFSHIKFEI